LKCIIVSHLDEDYWYKYVYIHQFGPRLLRWICVLVGRLDEDYWYDYGLRLAV
jgi:hypothetical protein